MLLKISDWGILNYYEQQKDKCAIVWTLIRLASFSYLCMILTNETTHIHTHTYTMTSLIGQWFLKRKPDIVQLFMGIHISIFFHYHFDVTETHEIYRQDENSDTAPRICCPNHIPKFELNIAQLYCRKSSASFLMIQKYHLTMMKCTFLLFSLS